ncbi:hypothetical protein [Rhodococcus triatomae]
MTTDDSDGLLASLGIDVEQMPALADDVWERVLERALDPTTELADASLVPEMDDTPIVPDDDAIDLAIDLDGDGDGDDSGVAIAGEPISVDGGDPSDVDGGDAARVDIELGPTLIDDDGVADDGAGVDLGVDLSDLDLDLGFTDDGGF